MRLWRPLKEIANPRQPPHGQPVSDLQDEHPDWDTIVGIMREARAKSRGYATYWEWAPDRSLAEVGVAKALAEYLEHAEGRSWESVQRVPHDPPDVLLISTSGERVGVEVTELVDPATVERHRHRKKIGANHSYDWANWSEDTLAKSLVNAVERKDEKLAARTKDYDELILALATDEPMITLTLAEQALRKVSVSVEHLHRAYFILSYHPSADLNIFPEGVPVLPVTLVRGDD